MFVCFQAYDLTARDVLFVVELAPWLLLLVDPPQAAAGDRCTRSGNGAVAVACGIVAVCVAGWAQLLDAYVLWPSSVVKAYVKV